MESFTAQTNAAKPASEPDIAEGTLLLPERMKFSDGRPWVKVDDETDCWIWQGRKMRGYGRVRVGTRSSVQAQRHVYALAFGSVPNDLDVGHKCFRRSCVNPKHMVLQTRDQNLADRHRMPHLGSDALAEVEEAILDDKPHSWISNEWGISHWSIRRIAANVAQYKLKQILQPVPF